MAKGAIKSPDALVKEQFWTLCAMIDQSIGTSDTPKARDKVLRLLMGIGNSAKRGGSPVPKSIVLNYPEPGTEVKLDVFRKVTVDPWFDKWKLRRTSKLALMYALWRIGTDRAGEAAEQREKFRSKLFQFGRALDVVTKPEHFEKLLSEFEQSTAVASTSRGKLVSALRTLAGRDDIVTAKDMKDAAERYSGLWIAFRHKTAANHVIQQALYFEGDGKDLMRVAAFEDNERLDGHGVVVPTESHLYVLLFHPPGSELSGWRKSSFFLHRLQPPHHKKRTAGFFTGPSVNYKAIVSRHVILVPADQKFNSIVEARNWWKLKSRELLARDDLQDAFMRKLLNYSKFSRGLVLGRLAEFEPLYLSADDAMNLSLHDEPPPDPALETKSASAKAKGINK